MFVPGRSAQMITLWPFVHGTWHHGGFNRNMFYTWCFFIATFDYRRVLIICPGPRGRATRPQDRGRSARASQDRKGAHDQTPWRQGPLWESNIAMENPAFIWLVVWMPFFIFPYIGNNNPNGLSYSSEGWPNHQPVL